MTRISRQKSGLVDFKRWYQHAFGKHTPWGDEDSPALVTEVETALERELSLRIMRGGARPRVETVREGATLVKQGDAGSDMYVLLDGVLSVEVDGTSVAQVGPGAVLGERAAARRWPADGDAPGAHAVQGRGRLRRRALPRDAQRAG